MLYLLNIRKLCVSLKLSTVSRLTEMLQHGCRLLLVVSGQRRSSQRIPFSYYYFHECYGTFLLLVIITDIHTRWPQLLFYADNKLEMCLNRVFCKSLCCLSVWSLCSVFSVLIWLTLLCSVQTCHQFIATQFTLTTCCCSTVKKHFTFYSQQCRILKETLDLRWGITLKLLKSELDR